MKRKKLLGQPNTYTYDELIRNKQTINLEFLQNKARLLLERVIRGSIVRKLHRSLIFQLIVHLTVDNAMLR